MQDGIETFNAAEAAEATELAWERHSARSEENHVLGHTQKWLNALPKGVRPLLGVAQHLVFFRSG